MTGLSRPAAWLAHNEGWLVLAAGPPLVLRERAPLWLEAAAVGWILLLWLARRRVTGRWTVATASDLPLVALVLTLPGALLGAMDQAGPLVRPAAELAAVGLSRIESLLFSIALYYALANAASTPGRVWSAARWLLVGGLGLGTVGWLAMTGQSKFPGLAALAARLPRIIVDLPHPVLHGGMHGNTVAALLILLWPLALALLWWPAPARDASSDLPGRPLGTRILAALLLVATAPLLLISQSRGAWLALAISVVVLAALRWPRLRPLVAGAGAVAAAGGVVLALLALLTSSGHAALSAASASGSADGGIVSSRLNLWGRSLALVQAYPFRGIGPATFPLVFGQDPRYPGVYIYQGVAHAHNILLQAALDYGLPGLVAVVGLYLTLFVTAWRAFHRLSTTALAPVAAGLACGLLAMALHGLVDAVAIGSKSGVLAWASAGLLAAERVHSPGWIGREDVSSSNGPPL